MHTISLTYRKFDLEKTVPLKISRGTTASSVCYVIELRSSDWTGLGEAAEFSIPGCENSSEKIEADLELMRGEIQSYAPEQRVAIENLMKELGIGSSVRAAIDMALYDWMGKATGLPIWKLLGLEPTPLGPVSVTIGINSPHGALERLGKWQQVGRIRALKVKLGSPEGIRTDQAMIEALLQVNERWDYVAVDANCGWTLDQAIEMSHWLKVHGVVHVEQPLSIDNDPWLKELKRQSALPIFVDESCQSAQDVYRLAGGIDGFNIKLSKVGGLSEALRMLAVGKTLGLKTLIGCYGNTALANGAAHQLASQIDYIDLDSHLNLRNDPMVGPAFQDGYLVNQHLPGLGVGYA